MTKKVYLMEIIEDNKRKSMLKIIIRDKNKNIIRCSYSKKLILYRDKIILNGDIYYFKNFEIDFEYVTIFKFLENNFYSFFYELKETFLRTVSYFIVSFILLIIFLQITDLMKNEIIKSIPPLMAINFTLFILLKDIKKPDTFNLYNYLVISIICFLSISNSLLFSTLKYLTYSAIADLLIFIFYVFIDLYKYNKSSIDVEVIYGEK